MMNERLRGGMWIITFDVEASDSIDNVKTDALDTTNKVQIRRAHSLEIEVCKRNVSVKHPEKSEVPSVEEGRRYVARGCRQSQYPGAGGTHLSTLRIRLTSLEFVDTFKVFNCDENGSISADELRHMKMYFNEKITDKGVDVMIRETDVDDVGEFVVSQQSAHV